MKITHNYLSMLLAFALLMNSVYAADSQIGLEQAGYKNIVTENNISFRSYVAGPQQSKQGLLLIHGWLGLNREMEVWANQFAVQGFRVMAIDLFNNQVAVHPAQARKLMDNVNQADANNKFRAAIKILAAGGRKVAVLGRSYGANQAIHAVSASNNRISAIVLYYPFGAIVTKNTALPSITAPILCNFANEDIFFDRERRADFISAAEKQGIKLKIENYSARHGFTTLFGKNFDADAEKTSSRKTFAFLAENLR